MTDVQTPRPTLSKGQIRSYTEQGYLVLRGVLNRADADDLRQEAHALMERLTRHQGMDATWASARSSDSGQTTQLLHCHNAQFQVGAFTRLLTDPRLMDPVSDLIGPNVQLHHTKLFVKPPERGSPFPLHQDHPFFPHEQHSVLAAMVHLDDAPLERGCLRVVPGSHRQGPLPHVPEGGFHLAPEDYPFEAATPIEAEAGDVIIFSYFCVHGSGVNTSSEARTTLLVQLRSAEDRPLDENSHPSRGQGMMLRGIDPHGKQTFGIDS